MHVDRLDFGTEAALGLQVAEDDQLADADHLAAELGDQHGAAASVRSRASAARYGAEVGGVLGRGGAGHGAEGEQLHDAAEVGLGGRLGSPGPCGTSGRSVVRDHARHCDAGALSDRPCAPAG